jgi:predicted amidophosphoribosyltransferase
MYCGFKLDARLTCPHCSAELIPGTKYCGNCGKAIENSGEK